MSLQPVWKPFLRHHFPAFVGVILLTILSMGCSVILMLLSYAPPLRYETLVPGMGAAIVLVMLLTHFNFLLARGLRRCQYINPVLLGSGLLLILPCIAFNPGQYLLYGVTLLMQLCGLYLWNSQHYARMVEFFAQQRAQRTAAIQHTKRQ